MTRGRRRSITSIISIDVSASAEESAIDRFDELDGIGRLDDVIDSDRSLDHTIDRAIHGSILGATHVQAALGPRRRLTCAREPS
jgi:hypothetical protein